MSYPAIESLSESMRNDLNELLCILKKYGVTKVLVYGSVARGDYKEESDIDICVEGLKNESFFYGISRMSDGIGTFCQYNRFQEYFRLFQGTDFKRRENCI